VPAGTSVSDNAPSSPQPGQLWWESDTGNLYIWYDDGNTSQWVQINSGAPQGLASPFKRTVITALGTTTSFQFDATTLTADIEVVGGGGGAGTTAGSSSAGTARAAAGGGAGGYAKKLITVDATVRAATKTITIGAAGPAITAGGASSYTDTVNTLQGVGGSPGAGMTPGTQLNFANGGTGGAGTGGDINIQGTTGAPGLSAGSVPNGASNASACGGNGAPGPWGGGGRGFSVNAGTGAAFADGAAATSYGAGGGGGYAVNVAGANAVGGSGYQGVVIITEYR
jgi:hypothetical protein